MHRFSGVRARSVPRGHDVGVITFLPDGSVETKGPHDVWDNGLEALICPLFE
jgi:hypothetical protein